MSNKTDSSLKTTQDWPVVDPAQDLPLHAQVRRALREMIEKHFEDGQKFYTEPELVAKLNASRGTVRRALADLAQEGLLDRQVAKGSFVRRSSSPLGAPSMPKAPGSRMNSIGVFTLAWDSAYHAGLLDGLSAQTRRLGCSMHIYHAHQDEAVSGLLRAVQQPPSEEGIVLLNILPKTTGELNEILTTRGYRTVNINTLIQDYPGAFLGTANETVIRMTLDHFRSLGHERIVFLVTEPEESGNVQEKLRLFESITREYGLNEARVVSSHTRYWEDSYAKAYETMPKVFRLPLRPTAIFTHSDTSAWAALRWCEDQGISVPGAVSIMGCNDDRPSRFTSPRLTTLSQPLAEMAERAVEMLLEGPFSVEPERFEPTLVVRDSTGPVPAAPNPPKHG